MAIDYSNAIETFIEIGKLYPENPMLAKQRAEEARELLIERFGDKSISAVMCEDFIQELSHFNRCLVTSYYKHKDLEPIARHYYLEAFMFSQNTSSFTHIDNIDSETAARLEQYSRGFKKCNNKSGDFEFEDVEEVSKLGIHDQLEDMFTLSDYLGMLKDPSDNEQSEAMERAKIILPTKNLK